MPCLRAYAPGRIRTHKPLITSREHEPLHHSAPTFLDFAKEFDTIGHIFLMQKMQHYGVSGIPFKWFENYFKNRTQFILYGGSESEK